ncbi:MAG TPA: type II toxin-antitoxin system RelE/ParE family toxin [Chitinophagales bacterium]|nr:type II toxin-antitoxin system RelE/ParE family toxin [Chitinophagales bacterium]
MEKEVKEIVWSKLAVSTLQIIYAYISEQSIKEAEKQIDRIFDRTESLAKGWIKIGQELDFKPGKLKFEYRYLVQDNYKIIYHEQGKAIRIDIVFDTRQDPKKLKRLLGHVK